MHAGRVLLTTAMADGDTLKMPEGAWQVRVFASAAGVFVHTPGDTGPGALCGTYRPEFFQMQQGETMKITGGAANVAVMTR